MKSYPYLEAGRAFAADIGDDRSRFLAIDARIRAEAVNTDEALVPEYTLPSPLVNADGSRVTSASEWMNFRRPEVLGLYERGMYGEIPPPSRQDDLRGPLRKGRCARWIGPPPRGADHLRHE